MNPLVSICMPHLNSAPFTNARIDSILKQTYSPWELVIVDSASNDGSRAVLEALASSDSRVRMFQTPRDGIYQSINRALAKARGEFVYLATSDDTMMPQCLEQMVAALQSCPDCGLAHCCLEIIDEDGRPVISERAWKDYTQQDYFADWVWARHVRRAPHDGILHLGFFTVYTSLTQLLVRRRVYEKRGGFRTDCGSYADFEWGMRIGLTENVVHVPEILATWRRHGGQATQPDQALRARARGEFRRLVRETLKSLDAQDRSLAVSLRTSCLNDYYLVDEFNSRRRSRGSHIGRVFNMAGFILKHPVFSLRWLLRKSISRKRMVGDFGKAVRDEFMRLGLPDLLQKADWVDLPEEENLPKQTHEKAGT